MDLSYDWKSFQSVFCIRKRPSGPESSPVFIVTDKRVVIAAFSEGESLSDWIGATTDEVMAKFANREIITFDREKTDQWMGNSVSQPHFYDQIQYLQSEVKPQFLSHKGMAKTPEVPFSKHFLLSALQSWWHKVFPSTYAIYFRLTGSQEQSLLITVQRGRISSFQVPDLSSMIPERKKYPADIVKFLSERYLMPIQGLFLSSSEWAEWTTSPNPWQKIAATLKSDRSKLVPFKWGVFSLVMIRAYLKV